VKTAFSEPRISLHPNQQIVVVSCGRGHLLTCCPKERWEDSPTRRRIVRGLLVKCSECYAMDFIRLSAGDQYGASPDQ